MVLSVSDAGCIFFCCSFFFLDLLFRLYSKFFRIPGKPPKRFPNSTHQIRLRMHEVVWTIINLFRVHLASRLTEALALNASQKDAMGNATKVELPLASS